MNYDTNKLISFNNDVLLSIHVFFFIFLERLKVCRRQLNIWQHILIMEVQFLFFIIEILNSKLNISIEKRNDGMEVTVIKVENFSFWGNFYQWPLTMLSSEKKFNSFQMKSYQPDKIFLFSLQHLILRSSNPSLF